MNIFEIEDTVTLKKEFIDRATEHEQLYGHELKVQLFKTANLGDCLVDVVYLQKKENTHTQNLS